MRDGEELELGTNPTEVDTDGDGIADSEELEQDTDPTLHDYQGPEIDFDADLFTVDSDHQIRASPSFDPGHPFLRETLIEKQGEQIALPRNARIGDKYLEKRNSDLGWL